VGKLALLGVAGLAAAAAIGVRSANANVQTLCVLGALIFAILIAIGILTYGFKFPDQATLILAFQQVQQMRAKDLPTPEQSGHQILGGLGTRPRQEGEVEP
jgi:hypothetical protein